VVAAVTALAAQPADGPELLDAALYAALTASRVTSLDAALDAQPTAALAPGCAADLRAVAEAIAANAANAGRSE
jgi:hypothetical protein